MLYKLRTNNVIHRHELTYLVIFLWNKQTNKHYEYINAPKMEVCEIVEAKLYIYIFINLQTLLVLKIFVINVFHICGTDNLCGFIFLLLLISLCKSYIVY